MMKDTKTEKNKLRRYLDDMYIREEASQLLESMRDADHKDILDELSAEVWEESVSQQPVTDLEREKYKKEARQLLKHIEHKKTYLVPSGNDDCSQCGGCNSHRDRKYQLFPVYE